MSAILVAFSLGQEALKHRPYISKNLFQMVKKISASILQCIDIAMFTGGHAKARVASLETTEGCPIAPGSSLQKVSYCAKLSIKD